MCSFFSPLRKGFKFLSTCQLLIVYINSLVVFSLLNFIEKFSNYFNIKVYIGFGKNMLIFSLK
jgi:hypothetical protein